MISACASMRTASTSCCFTPRQAGVADGSVEGTLTVRLLPRHYRYVDRPLRSLAAYRLDGVVDVLQAEAVGRHQLEREALRTEVVEGELHRAVRMAARALQRHPLASQTADRKVREY